MGGAEGSSSIRLIQTRRAHHRADSIKLMQKLLGENANVVYVSTVFTATEVRQHVGKSSRLYCIDATGHGPIGVAFTTDAFYVDSPTKLEKIALIIRRISARFENPHIIVDHVDSIASINEKGPAVAFIHLLCHNMSATPSRLDVMITDSTGTEELVGVLGQMTGPPVSLQEILT